ncbi:MULTISPECIES: tyrosine-type recombinase/integrase [Klebsiella/Raoultella group]|uniref:Tyrosine-type recombinase/integrase n=2 Tax=Klebsiella/Raoultella group TaxID=2890311 RepID=A0A839CCG1_9ENTR|nr:MULTISPECIES: tyrosine-type recombinase/integrase [Klebsiella/Raoultella group]EKZ2442266.1 tyrosine-type recombinase/integrase [Citrobacter freundii]MBA8009428.1 tyrosine-type recombinase/integrase [Klebsiella grimontii]MBA8123024.1 tyrosine-type recombinase/integrase [Klebsiella grimontii]MDW4554985.1 tyrosine-type recombinase/integrase [Raoultella planticola]MDZ7445729.1 tyrosine-type recombinase/integrase [Raoultella planticola]
MKVNKDDRYLITDAYGVYYCRIVLPAYLHDAFGGKKTLVRSLKTSDLRVARRKRDAIVTEYERVRELAAPPKPDSIQDTISYLQSVAKYARASPVAQSAETRNSRREPSATPNNNKANKLAPSCPSLVGMLDVYLLQNADVKKIGTLSKDKRAVTVFLSYLKRSDIQLSDITRTNVSGWCDYMKENGRAIQTQANFLSSMAGILDLAAARYHDAPPLEKNPFRGHKLNTAKSRESYEAFTDQDVIALLRGLQEAGEGELFDVASIAAYSGMRIGEICNLKPEHIIVIDNVHLFHVQEGKTSNAARVVPIASKILPMVLERCQKPYNGFLFYRASITKREDGKRSSWHVNRFGRLKRDILPDSENKVFHSYRHTWISKLNAAGVDESRIALLAGHSFGETESFKTYSKSVPERIVKELQSYVELISYK